MYQYRPLFVQMANTDDGSDRVYIADLDTETDEPCDGLTVSYDYRLNSAKEVAVKYLNSLDVYIHGYTINSDHYILYITDFNFILKQHTPKS